MRLAAALLALVLSACSERVPTPEVQFERQEKVLTGYMMHNWEAGFTVFSLGLEGVVCLDSSLIGRELGEPKEDVVLVAVRGHLSERGRYGHMGGCTYVFRVSAVAENRPLTVAERGSFFQLARNVFEPPPDEDPGAGFDRAFPVE